MSDQEKDEQETPQDEMSPDTNTPWRRSSVLKVSIAPKDFRVVMTVARRGTVPVVHLAAGPAREGLAEDSERSTTFALSGDLGLEIHREADGQGVEYEQEFDDDNKDNPPWQEILNQILPVIGGAVAARTHERAIITPYPGNRPFPPVPPFRQGPPFPAGDPFPSQGAWVSGDPDARSLEDQAMFGPAYRDVIGLRAEVALRNSEGNAFPPEAIAALLVRVARTYETAPFRPRAFELFNGARWTALVAAVLPEAAADYRQSIVAALVNFTGKANVA